MNATSTRRVHADDYVSDVSVAIGLALRDQLVQRHPGRVRARLRDSPLTTVPGHTILVRPAEHSDRVSRQAYAADAAREMITIVLRDLHRQLDAAGIDEESDQWSVALTWDGHGLFGDGRLVHDGFRFDAYVKLYAEPASPRVEVV